MSIQPSHNNIGCLCTSLKEGRKGRKEGKDSLDRFAEFVRYHFALPYHSSALFAMAQSIFITPSFIVVELGFLLSSLISAYELFVGDFVWAREEEERRSTIQRSRGRGMMGQRQLYPSTQRQYHRSLSPRSGKSRGLGHGGTEDETTSLLQGRRYSKKLNDSGASDEFPSPGDLRSVEMGVPGRGGSTGDSTRRLVSKF
jgi:hypothetical protein